MRWLLLVLLFTLPVFAQTSADSIPVVGVKQGLSDDELLELVQRQTFRYFWHGGHPASGMALERSDTVRADFYWDFINEANDEPNLSRGTFGPQACAVGGTGFGIMATLVAIERKWISREAGLDRLIKIADFLNHADCYHGIYPHFIDGTTGRTIPFGRTDDGSDAVETSYLLMGFLAAREYFKGPSLKERYLTKRIDEMWNAANWAWHVQPDGTFMWHWSAKNGFDMNFPIFGWDECLITYILAASSPTHAITKEAYLKTWHSPGWKNGKAYYGITLPLGNYNGGGPLFFEQYTFLGINPNGLTDDYGIDYAEQVKNHTLINRAYCLANPKGFKGYGPRCWGLTAGDSVKGYVAHCPEDDRGVIQPTAALSSMPFTPQYSMEALRGFYEDRGDKLWTEYGFIDGFSEHHNWYARSHLAIDQLPIVVMIENHRTGFLWKLFMRIPEIRTGLARLGFKAPS